MKVVIILKVLATRLGSNSQCSIMCHMRRTHIVKAQGSFGALCNVFCSIVSALSLSLGCVHHCIQVAGENKLCSLAVQVAVYDCCITCWTFLFFKCVFLRKVIFLAALYYSQWYVFVVFFFYSVWNLCYWRETEVLLRDYLMFLKCVKWCNLFISNTASY